MNIELPSTVEHQLRDLAVRQGRELSKLVEDAVRQYVEAAAITDLDPSEVAEAQADLVRELPPLPDWKARAK